MRLGKEASPILFRTQETLTRDNGFPLNTTRSLKTDEILQDVNSSEIDVGIRNIRFYPISKRWSRSSVLALFP
ncbi:hypothetical protein KCV00_g80, partial [Aureobasidium melanogenum]